MSARATEKIQERKRGERVIAAATVRERKDIGHARTKYIGKYQSYMVSNGRLIPHASHLLTLRIIELQPPRDVSDRYLVIRATHRARVVFHLRKETPLLLGGLGTRRWRAIESIEDQRGLTTTITTTKRK